jgi:protein-L-isoaspartate O-methyltransferase
LQRALVIKQHSWLDPLGFIICLTLRVSPPPAPSPAHPPFDALQVRAAAEDAARSIMGQLSASGVKLVLPALLKGLEDSAWRTKQGSIQLLGAMAHCAPKQLGSCLPTIVPRLGGVLGDPHPKVAAAAQLALQEVSAAQVQGLRSVWQFFKAL